MKVTFKKLELVHEDDRRKLFTIFNGTFTAKQIKMIQCKKTSILGGHYHNYREMFYIVEGKASFELQDVDTNEKVNTELLAGDIMILAPRIAHKVLMEEGTFSLEATEKSYISPEMNDVKYEVNLY